MALPEIPIWSFLPNWREGITERLSWLTDVLDSNNGTEQRRALRLSPRRSFEMLFNPTNAVRSYFGLFLHRLATEEFMLPIYHDKAPLTSAVIATATSLPFDNTYREFETGGYAILLRDPFNYEVVEITDQDDMGITISALVNGWPKGTTVYPLCRSRLSDESTMAALTSRVGQSTTRFELTQANDYDEGAWTETYSGLPLLTETPNRRESIDLSFLRKSDLQDNEIGLSYLVDEADRAFTVQMHSWMVRGRQKHAEFRSMLYRLRGRHQAVWLPTFNEDIVLARATASANSYLHVDKIGYAYTGGVVSGRDHVMFRHNGGVIPLRITGLGGALADDEERLNLSTTVGAILPAGRSASFLEVARLDQDNVEIHHKTDSNGVSECKAAFRSFLNTRIEDELVAAPLPSGFMNAITCGSSPLTGLSWLLPCTSYSSPNSCGCAGSVETSVVVPGVTGLPYNLTFRVRGVIELALYSGGTVLDPDLLVENPTSASGTWNLYSLEVSDPPTEYFLNKSVSPVEAVGIVDYEFTIVAKGGSTLTLKANSKGSFQISNPGAVVIADDDASNPIVVSQPFNGQFLQLDLV